MNNKFSENLKKIRKDNNLSQEQLADELGVSRQAISKWESKVAYPEMDKIITLCEKFNLNIDDLLHKDIREIKREEESKKSINKYADDFLNFITNTINMFSSMSFKSKFKCLFEQVIIGTILFIVCLMIGILGQDLLSGIFGLIPDKLYYVIFSLLQFVYSVLAILFSLIIMVHIFKTRYLNYYKRIQEQVIKNNKDEKYSENINNKKEITFKQNEEKIIIRDPKHSEYKFINGLFNGFIIMIKFFALCFAIILFLFLIGLCAMFILSFLTIKSGMFFIGLLLVILASSIIDIVIILIVLNFIFNRKNDKKKMIWSFISSLIVLGVGIGLILVGLLNFEYVKNDKDILKTEYIELEMNKDLIFGYYMTNVEFIESNNKNIKLEYTLNKYCNFDYDISQDNIVHLYSSCDNPIRLLRQVINKFNDKKIVSINNDIHDIKIYTTKENIEILKKNYLQYFY